MRYFLEHPYDYYLILSGDQLYRMDFRALLHQHIRLGADITLATKPVACHQVFEFDLFPVRKILFRSPGNEFVQQRGVGSLRVLRLPALVAQVLENESALIMAAAAKLSAATK